MARYPKIVGDTWFNLPQGKTKLEETDFSNKVILFDFWTYSGVNCIRTFPYLQEWWNKYKDRGLLIIGIHTPEFRFEKDITNIVSAMSSLGVTWPVVLDNNYENWNNFANKYWPGKYLSDNNGYIVYKHFGEGAYKETEIVIQRLLREMGAGDMPVVEEEDHIHGSACFIPTADLYCGFKRGVLTPPQVYKQGEILTYEAPKEITNEGIALIGSFLSNDEFVESQAEGATLLLHFHATEVNLVLNSQEGSAEVEVTYNSLPLSSDIKGKDLTESSDVIIENARAYNIVKSNHSLEGILKIKAVKNNFQAFSFTFSGCS